MILAVIRLWAIMLFAAMTVSCGLGASDKITKVSQIAMGTLVEVSAVGPPSQTKPAIEEAFNELKRVEALTSFHKDSGLTQINNWAGKADAKADQELIDLIDVSIKFAQLSEGAFDPTIGPIARLWNFSGNDGPRLPGSQEIEATLPLVGWKLIQTDTQNKTVSLPEQDMALDLGAIAKGYALDRAAEKMKSMGVKSALINAGGDIVAFGVKAPGKPWRIGIQDPRNPNGMIAVAEINDRAVVTSGDYERFFIQDDKRYHHILDPKTGQPAYGLQSVTIVAPDGVTADALSTAVFVLGKEKGLALVESFPEVYSLVIDSQGSIAMSKGAENIFDLKH